MRLMRWVAVVAALAVVGLLTPETEAGGDPAPGLGELRVTTTPAVGATIVVDGIARDTWGLTWLDLAAGPHTVCFTGVPGYATPPCEVVAVAAGATTTVVGSFTRLAALQVTTDPAVPATITVRDVAAGTPAVPMDDWGVRTHVTPGRAIEVCFGPVADHLPPPCEQVSGTSLVAGELTTVTGTYVPSLGEPGATGHGLLRVTTSPAVPAAISVDGVVRDDWGLDWVKVAPGSYEVCFGDVPGLGTPACEQVQVTAGATTSVQGTYGVLGAIAASVDPASEATISIDGVPRDDWGVWLPVDPGTHQVCFGISKAYGTQPAPTCQDVVVTTGTATEVTGTYPTTLGPGIDPTDAAAVAAAWGVITATPPALGYTGDQATCTPGTTSAAYRASMLARTNAYRALTGVEPVVEDAAFTTQAQATALLMAANGALSHYPPANWRCRTTLAVEGAAGSNLGVVASSGPLPTVDHVTRYMADATNGNHLVGHRRWVTCPEVDRVGFGKAYGTYLTYDGQFDAMTVSPLGPVTETRDGFVAWPNRGLVPVDLADAASLLDRFSVMVPLDHSVASATVTISSSSGPPVTPTELYRNDELYCTPALVWRPSRDPVAGESWTISVTGIRDDADQPYALAWTTDFVTF